MTGDELRQSRKAMGMKVDEAVARLSKRARRLIPKRTYQGWEARGDKPVPIDASEAMTKEIAEYQSAAEAVRSVAEG